MLIVFFVFFFFFFFNDTATTEIYTLSLHDALPICFFREHIQELLLASHETVHRFARKLCQSFAFERLAGLGGIDPLVGLLGCNGQKMLLHVDEIIHTAADQIRHGSEGRRTAPPLIYSSEE